MNARKKNALAKAAREPPYALAFDSSLDGARDKHHGWKGIQMSVEKIVVECPECGVRLRASPAALASQCKCPKCDRMVYLKTPPPQTECASEKSPTSVPPESKPSIERISQYIKSNLASDEKVLAMASISLKPVYFACVFCGVFAVLIIALFVLALSARNPSAALLK